MAMKEAQLESLLQRRIVKDIGGLCIKMAPTQVGVPDRLLLLPGGVLALVELKTETGKVSAAQNEWARKARDRGIDVHYLFGEAGVKLFCDQVELMLRQNGHLGGVAQAPECDTHKEIQHRDMKPPWCGSCGWNRSLDEKLGEPHRKGGRTR